MMVEGDSSRLIAPGLPVAPLKTGILKGNQMMNDTEWETLKNKIEKEFPIRLQLAELAGRPSINIKNYKALEQFDSSIAQLFLEIALNKPENIQPALQIIKESA
jgi:hypothetical protein